MAPSTRRGEDDIATGQVIFTNEPLPIGSRKAARGAYGFLKISDARRYRWLIMYGIFFIFRLSMIERCG